MALGGQFALGLPTGSGLRRLHLWHLATAGGILEGVHRYIDSWVLARNRWNGNGEGLGLEN